jgi:hypothetical protein
LVRIYRDLGAEKSLVEQLEKHGIHSLRSLEDVETHIRESDEIIEKKRNLERTRILNEIQNLKKQHASLMEDRTSKIVIRQKILVEERVQLQEQLSKPRIPTRNPIKWIIRAYRRWKSGRRLRHLENHFMEELEKPLRTLTREIKSLEKETEFLENNIEGLIQERLYPEIIRKQRIDYVLKNVQTWISGARGERDVVEALRSLPDTYIIINDIKLQLDTPMMSEVGLRTKCQADHIVIGPPGLFNIETKNWSYESISRLDFRSPIQQIIFTGKALYSEVNRAIRKRRIKIKRHHWGERGIRVYNILAMVGAMPQTEFQHVKMLPVNRLKGYIEYFESIFKPDEVNEIANWIILATQDKRT